MNSPSTYLDNACIHGDNNLPVEVTSRTCQLLHGVAEIFPSDLLSPHTELLAPQIGNYPGLTTNYSYLLSGSQNIAAWRAQPIRWHHPEEAIFVIVLANGVPPTRFPKSSRILIGRGQKSQDCLDEMSPRTIFLRGLLRGGGCEVQIQHDNTAVHILVL